MLNLDPVESSPSDIVEPDSIVQICKDNSIPVVLAEDSLGGFMEGYLNAKEANLQFSFMYRCFLTNDVTKDPEEYWDSAHRVLISVRNKAGYEKLIKLSTIAGTKHNNKGFHFLDAKILREYWDDSLDMLVPFYDSFLHSNNFRRRACLPDFSFAKPILLLEDNGLPFDFILRALVKKYAKNEKLETLEAQTIYYKSPEDFTAWQTFRCMKKMGGRHRTLERPELPHCCSDTFNFEHWKERNES